MTSVSRCDAFVFLLFSSTPLFVKFA